MCQNRTKKVGQKLERYRFGLVVPTVDGIIIIINMGKQQRYI